MFFDDEPLALRRHARLKQLPPVIDTGWRPPTSFPNLSDAKLISFDTETKELDFSNGPGWARGQGHIIGVSVGAVDSRGNRGAWYFPVRHEVEPEYNLDARNVFGWLGETLSTQTRKVGANLTYDIGWLGEEGITVNGPLEEVQFAEALIDSDAFVALDVLGRKYVRRGKATSGLFEWVREAYPNTKISEWKSDLYRTSPRLVAPYAIEDAVLPIDVYLKQAPLLAAENFDYVYRLECDLIPLMIKMRRKGVTVNTGLASEMLGKLQGETQALYKRVFNEYGWNMTASDSGNLGRLFQHVGIPTPLTDAGNPSVRKEWLAALTHPLGDLINDIREHEKICGTFLESYVLNKSVREPGSNSHGRLFPQFHQMKNDENGTVVGRYSSSDPNLQNIPSRTDLGKLVRTLFECDNGHFNWKKFDYSQIHYRILAHNAVDDPKGPFGGAEALRESYRNDPKMDYHNQVYMNVAPLMGWSVTDPAIIKQKRRIIKNVNFSLLYGVGMDAMIYKYLIGMSKEEVTRFFDSYYRGAPYVKPTMAAIAAEVQSLGYVTTLLGRRIRFNTWEPIKRDWDNPRTPLPYREAIDRYGSAIKRAFDYRGVNYKFQGTEPDIMKNGMRECYNSGVFDYTGVPRITVHDELNFSVQDDTPKMREAFAFIRHTMQNNVQLRVPVYVDESNGPNWGKAD